MIFPPKKCRVLQIFSVPNQSQKGSKWLDGLDDFGGDVTGQGKACRLTVDLHGPSHGLERRRWILKKGCCLLMFP